MHLETIIGICITVLIVAVMRIILKNEANRQSKKITNIPPYKGIEKQETERNNIHQCTPFIDIFTNLENNFAEEFITSLEKEKLIQYYIEYYKEAHSLTKKLKRFYIKPPENITKLILDFENLEQLIQKHNELVIQDTLDIHNDFFDHCLKYPLDKQQRRSIVSEEDNCLVVSSAGSGKTSSIVGKVRYLINIKHINPQNILLISYTNKAAAELTERMDIAGLRGYTFHKLAIDCLVLNKLTLAKVKL